MNTNNKSIQKKLTTPILIATLISLLATFGCGKSESSASAPLGVAKTSDPQIDSMGVFADTDRGLIKIGAFGSQYGGRTSYKFDETFVLDSVLRVDAFYINIPQFVLSDENGLIWSDTQLFKSQLPIFNEQNGTAIAINIQKSASGIFKIPVPNSSRSHPGVLILKVHMPLGSPDRLYALSKSL